jgi:hypothetical protein
MVCGKVRRARVAQENRVDLLGLRGVGGLATRSLRGLNKHDWKALDTDEKAVGRSRA